MKSETFFNGRVILHPGDCLKVMDKLAENSVDSCCCDPPYHLQSIVKRFAKTGRTDKTRTSSGPHQRTANGFMNKQWDGGDVAFNPETWARVLRVLKPGGYIVAFSSSRTFGRMSVAIEDAGFITHPMIAWMFGQGFPKAHRIAASGLSDLDRETEGWEGWRYGTQSTKPAIEPIYVGQKPFEAGLNGWQNIQKWGVGAININGCRIGVDGGTTRGANGSNAGKPRNTLHGGNFGIEELDAGRWPANVVHDGSDEVVERFPIVGDSHPPDNEGSIRENRIFGADARPREFHAGFADAGSASRFFYTAKADSDDRLGSKHPTVKPVDLMQWLVRLVTPPKGLILDPFAGTGTTGEAAWREGFRAVLIERETEYQDDIRRRMGLCLAGPDERAREAIKAKLKGKPLDHGPLFGGTEMTRGGGGRMIYGHFADQDEPSDP